MGYVSYPFLFLEGDNKELMDGRKKGLLGASFLDPSSHTLVRIREPCLLSVMADRLRPGGQGAV
jgi:hypothetical protein